MDKIRRVYVEKKPGADAASSSLLQDLRETLGLQGLSGLRILSVYDVKGLTDTEFEKCKTTVFSEPPVDFLYEEDFPAQQGDFIFGAAYLPGQFDQRADSLLQCIQAVTQNENVYAASSLLYILSGSISEEDCKKIKEYCINPVDSAEIPVKKPEKLELEMPEAAGIKKFEGFIKKAPQQVYAMRENLGLAMSADDLLFCHAYFSEDEKRDPTETEIKVIDTYWSDHCRHTTFLTAIDNVTFEDGPYKELFEEAYNLYLEEREFVGNKKEKTLMDMAVMGAKALRAKGEAAALDESEEINACSIVINVDVNGQDEKWLLMFKNETHNHPTEIEPFGGAATCLGGAIRDPLAGRAYVYQAMRITGSADPRRSIEETLPSKLPQRKITRTAAAGFSSYGNQIGLTTGYVNEIYHEGYAAKRMELGAVIGAVKAENVIRKRPEKGDLVILVGGRTGRDGCGGATGSSKEHSEESLATCGAEVQKGNPPTERKLLRLFRNPDAAKMIKRCNDFGAGGVAVAIGELSDGLIIDLESVPKKYNGLTGTELAISESQERMAVVISPENEEAFIKYAAQENLEATRVAVITDDKRLVMNWRGEKIVNLSREFLDTNGVRQEADVYVASPQKRENPVISDPNYVLAVLSDLNVASQKGLIEMFDSSIGSGTVLTPLGGVNQLTPIQAMAAKIPVEDGETDTVSIMAHGYDPYLSEWSPFHGAVCAVVDSVAKAVAAGANRMGIYLSFQEYFERLGNNNSKWGKPFAALLGGFYAQMKLGTASIGGKDSMSGTFKDINVPPTLVSFAVGTAKAKDVISPEFKKAGNTIILLETKYDNDGLPDLDEFIRNLDLLHNLILEKKVISAYAVGTGGVAAALCKMSFGNLFGVKVKYDDLYNKKYGSFVLEIASFRDENYFSSYNYTILGEITNVYALDFNGLKIDITNALAAWLSPLEKVFPTNHFADNSIEIFEAPEYKTPVKVKSKIKSAHPVVFMPVFPGTNCEYDMKKQFEVAGARVNTFVIRNLSLASFTESVQEAEKLIRNSQIIALPGGFSAGDEPDGSGKFIAAFFKNPYLMEAVTDLLDNRDGLMLGICNGFQALLKLGLIRYGRITDLLPDDMTLVKNEIGRHTSCFTQTKIVSNKSPWLYNTNAGDRFMTAISHGEGRFYASSDGIKELIANNQIAIQYVDFSGEATNDIRYNPNGSAYAVEAVTSPDGRVLGKMGHSERIGENLYKNIPGPKDQKIFLSGVEYFS